MIWYDFLYHTVIGDEFVAGYASVDSVTVVAESLNATESAEGTLNYSVSAQ